MQRTQLVQVRLVMPAPNEGETLQALELLLPRRAQGVPPLLSHQHPCLLALEGFGDFHGERSEIPRGFSQHLLVTARVAVPITAWHYVDVTLAHRNCFQCHNYRATKVSVEAESVHGVRVLPHLGYRTLLRDGRCR